MTIRDAIEDAWFPRRVTILAPGPNGEPYWDLMDKVPGVVLAVNYGITIPAHIDGWLVTDWWALKTKWFEPHHLAFKGLRIYSEGLITKIPEYTQVRDPHFFIKLVDGHDCVKPLGCGEFKNVPDRLRPDGSVSASAVELAVKRGVKEIVLCGVDMEGSRYYDGSSCTSTDCDHVGEWAFTPYFNSLIRWAKEQGVDIWSLSKTTLDIEVRG